MCAAKNPIIEEIVDQHFDEASFLWQQRDVAVTSSNYSLPDLAFLDERVEAHIDGLRIAADHGWALCEDCLDAEDPGTVFAAAVLAFESNDKERMDLVVGAASESFAAFRAAVSALGWMKKPQFNAIAQALVSTKSRRYRRLGIAACGIRRVNPRGYLDQAINSSHIPLKARALKAAGELKRVDLLPQLQKHFQHEDDTCRFEAARSALLMGDRSAIEPISTFIISNSVHTLSAMQIALRLVDTQTARNWLKAQSRNPEQSRTMIIGTGITGEPAYIPMLIKQMQKPKLARIAGGAFSMITGVNLENEKLDSEWPEGFVAGPTDEIENENVEMDADEDLPWPDAALIQQWWEQNTSAMPAGPRYVSGTPVSQECCTQVLKIGNQYLRQAAALELALSAPEAVYFNIKSPGYLQRSGP
jgi:uncharacterized protein (TIGR02270 family)